MADVAEVSAKVETGGKAESPESPTKGTKQQTTITVSKASGAINITTQESDGDAKVVNGEDATNGPEPKASDASSEKADPVSAPPSTQEIASKPVKDASPEPKKEEKPEVPENKSESDIEINTKLSEDTEVVDEGIDADSSEDEEEWVPTQVTPEKIAAVVQVCSTMPEDKLKKCLDFFWTVDTNRYGYFTIEQFWPVMKKWKYGATTREVVELFRALDHDENGYVTLDEFLEELSAKRVKDCSIEDVKELFDEVDVNKDGLICSEDLDAWIIQNYPYTEMAIDPIRDAIRLRVKFGGKVDIDTFLELVKRHSI